MSDAQPPSREVAVAAEVYDYLKQTLPARRTAKGSASYQDFIDLVLPTIIEEFSAVDSPRVHQLIPGRPEYEVLTITNSIFPILAATAMSHLGGSVEIIEILIDVSPPETFA